MGTIITIVIMMMIIAKKFHLMEGCFESQEISKKKIIYIKISLEDSFIVLK